MGYEVLMDFHNDWANTLKQQLEARGYTLDPGLSADDVCVQFYGLFQRLIDSRPRKVEMSKEFTCPAEHELGMRLLIEKIKQGLDLTPHLSSRQEDLDYTDPLLNDWSIYHLHLGTTLDSRGMINRTGPILFALFTDDTAYFINVYEHGRRAGRQPWSAQDMIRIIDENWPHITEPFKLKGVKPERTVTDEEYAMLRKAGVQVISVAGMAMGPMGGGVTSARTSVSVRLMCDDVLRQMRELEKWVRGHIDEIVQNIRQTSDYGGEQFNFTLTQTDTGGIEIVETHSRVVVVRTA